jgi:hypothetical protein
VPPIFLARLRPTIRWIAAAASALALLTLVEWRPSAQAPARPIHWEGTLTSVVTEDFARQEIPFADGVWTATFQVRVKWLEKQRIDVKDPSGRTTGQLVMLVDDGSSWTAEASGIAVTRSRPERLQLVGSGSGAAVLQGGWVYQSMADDDPLADILPNGAYALWTAADLQVRHIFTATDGTIIEQRSPGEVPPQQMLNAIGTRLPVVFWNGQTPVPAALDTTGLRRLMANSLADYPFADRERRTLIDGRMTGSYEARGRASEAGMTRRVTWDLHRRLGIAGTLETVDAKWRPKLAEQVTIRAALDPSQGVTGRFRFTLFDVSREKGYAMNAGGSGTGLDLRFSSTHPQAMEAPVEKADGYTIETTEAGLSAGVTIAAFDYGAWGRLKAEVNVAGEWYLLDAAGGGTSVTIPLDTNANRIWDTWERNTGVWGEAASADNDDLPDGENAGDGFSNFEEYRGFMVGPDWVASDPNQKNLFVYDANGLGIGDFPKSGVWTYLVDQNQLDGNRVANFNRGYGSAGAQKGLKLESHALAQPGRVGETSRVGTPNQVTYVYIDTLELMFEDSAATDSTIAHELGHAVSVEHHGDYTEGRCNAGPKGLIAPWGGAYAGDRGCVMAYSAAAYYRGWDGQCYDWTFPEEWGDTFCTTKTGTGINAGARRMEDGHPLPVSGDAAHGNCQHQVRLK